MPRVWLFVFIAMIPESRCCDDRNLQESRLGYTNALNPVIARPTISVLISRVPS